MRVFFLAVALLLLGLVLRAFYAPEWVLPAQDGTFLHPWQVEADGYSELTRVQHILNGQGLIQNFHPYENWPEGMQPTLTAPFDYAIILLDLPLHLFTRYPLDWAGALVSPVLWLALFLFWARYSTGFFSGGARLLLLLGVTALPSLVWATSCGRARHVSLIIVLLALALCAEYERWSAKGRTWHVTAGILWGLACWTSLFEPLILWVLLLVFNLAVRRQENRSFLISFGVIMLVALLLEGVHLSIPPVEYRGYLGRWFVSIAELQSVSPFIFFQQLTVAVLFLPWAGWQLWRSPDRVTTDLFLLPLTALLLVLSFLQARWIYFSGLAELLLLARYVRITPQLRWQNYALLTVFLLSLTFSNVYQIETALSYASNQPSAQEEQVARSIDAPGGILGPWWLAAGLGYFSGEPTVACSSHCSIPGIVDSARFYSAVSWVNAYALLEKRKVRWIVVYDNPRYTDPLLNNSRNLLGEPAIDDLHPELSPSIATLLIQDRWVPPALRLRCVTQNFKLYEYAPPVLTLPATGPSR